MKRLLSSIIGVALMFFIQNNYVQSFNSFSILEERVNEITSFVENGVRSESTTHNTVDDEIKYIINKIENIYKVEPIREKNHIIVENDNIKIDVNLYSNSGTTYVDIELINYDKNYKIADLIKDIQKLQSDNIIKIKYFKYVKGKIYKKEEILKYINKEDILDNIQELSIHNGYVGTADLCNGERVNFVNSSYDTGSYFLIGSPIIFTTY